MTTRCDRPTCHISDVEHRYDPAGEGLHDCTCDSWRCQGRRDRLCGCQDSGRRVGDQKGGVRGRLEEKGQLGGARDWMEGRGTADRR